MNDKLANKLYQLVIDTNGDPSLSAIKELGYNESQAIEMVIRMANADRTKLVEIAKEKLGKES